jgi:hypothetical protein
VPSDTDEQQDVVEFAAEFERRLLLIPEDRVFTKRVVMAGFCVLTSLLLLILGGIVGITLDTNRGLERQVVPLQDRVAELEELVSDQADVIDQQTAAILQLAGILQENGITPPEIVIRPSD